MKLLCLTLLFIVLSPGVLLTLPPVGKQILFSGKTSLLAVVVHAFVFYLIASFCLLMIEGFEAEPAECNVTKDKPKGCKCAPKRNVKGNCKQGLLCGRAGFCS